MAPGSHQVLTSNTTSNNGGDTLSPATNGIFNIKPTIRSAPDTWFFPDELKNDLRTVGLPDTVVDEILACSWEYVRCVIPHFTNWERYLAFARTIVIGIVAEFCGSLVDVLADGANLVLGYDLDGLFDIIFAGTPGREDMAREYRTFLLITGDKCSNRRDSDLFRRYVNILAKSPKTWFRLRDCDALARYTIAGALACNDLDDAWFTEDEFQMLSEIGVTLYDAVAFHKHRAEGETNSTFAYVDSSLRKEAYKMCRELLWALDAAWVHRARSSPARRCAINFLRQFGGPIHMTMRRYRFVEDGLIVGKPETHEVVTQTRRHFKLWNRVDATRLFASDSERYQEALGQRDTLLIAGLAELLEQDDKHCGQCRYRQSYGAELTGRFGGVELCEDCKTAWREYVQTLPQRAASVFPALSAALFTKSVVSNHAASE